MIIGGTSNTATFSTKTWFYNGWYFEIGPKLHTARHSHSAAMITDSVTYEKFVVAAGGINSHEEITNSIEFLNLNVEGTKWETGTFRLKTLLL